MDIHCPTEVMAVGTIIFPVRVGEQFFFQYGLEFIESFQLQVLIRQICCPITKRVSQRNERIPLPEQGIEPGTSSL